MSVKDELLAIQTAHEGILNPRDVVTWAAKNKRSALYAALEWDDPTAANAHRLWQVRQLIQLHVVTENHEPLMVSLSIDRRDGGYRSISDVVQVPNLRDIMLEDALSELNRVQAKYQRVTELTNVWKEAETVRQGRRRKRAA